MSVSSLIGSSSFRGVGLKVAAILGIAAFVCTPLSLAGQEPGTAVLEGTVFDSTSMQLLSGARVAVIGTNAVAETDASGSFRLVGIPAGSHWVSFFHDRLQSLGVSPPSRQVTFATGQTVRLALSVPSEQTLLAGWCLAEQPAPGFAAVAGVVTDSLTGVPMSGAIVRAEAASRIPGIQPVEVRADDSGYFRMCSVRADVDLRLQASFGQSRGRTAEVVVPAGGALVQDLVLLMSAEGTLAGYVRDYATGGAIQGAVVSVAGTTSSTLTDLTGRFILDDLPPGRHLITTDHLAFEERTDSVTIFSEETVDIEVNMATEALEVEGLVVTARTRFGRTSLAGDAKRADFIGREDIEVMLPRVSQTADILRSMNAPGMRIRDVYQVDRLTGVMIPGLCIEVSRRAGGEGCMPAAVALNGVVVSAPDQVIRDLDPNVIDRIEILSPVDAQFQFGSIAGNGAIAIYTR
jgi:hypothetical protein